MKKSAIIGILIIIIILILALLLLRSGSDGGEVVTENNTTESSIFSGDKLFELPNYDGDLVRSKDFKQDIIVINAWATWCPFCVNELPDFAALQKKYPEDVAIIAINRAEPLGTAKSYSDGLGLDASITFLVDPDDKFYKSIGGFSMPETLFVNKKGEILFHKKGPMNLEEMETIVESYFSS